MTCDFVMPNLRYTHAEVERECKLLLESMGYDKGVVVTSSPDDMQFTCAQDEGNIDVKFLSDLRSLNKGAFDCQHKTYKIVREVEGYCKVHDFLGVWDTGFDITPFGTYNHRHHSADHEGEGPSRNLARLSQMNTFSCIATHDTLYVCVSPEVIRVDDEGSLHCDDGPAVIFEDGTGAYFIHGESMANREMEIENKVRPSLFESYTERTKREVRDAIGVDCHLSDFVVKRIRGGMHEDCPHVNDGDCIYSVYSVPDPRVPQVSLLVTRHMDSVTNNMAYTRGDAHRE